MSDTSRRLDELRLAEQAADWLDRLERGNDGEAEAFAKWLTESRRNVEAFLFATAMENALQGMDPARAIDVEALLSRAAPNVVDFSAAAPRPAAQGAPPDTGRIRSLALRQRWKWAAGFAVTMLMTGTWWFVSGPGSWSSFVTGVGEQRTVRLSDGSLLQLNTGTRIRTRFTDSARELRLLYGEALFNAERDNARPFRVHAGGTVVQAIGTRFNVYHRTGATTVAVLEGVVQITPADAANGPVTSAQGGRQQAAVEPRIVAGPTRLSAGKGARIAATGRVQQVESVDPDKATAWRQRRLIFDRETLANIAEEFNRYNVAPHIRVDGELARAKRYTGIFDADDPTSLLQYLGRDASLAIEQRDDELVIEERR